MGRDRGPGSRRCDARPHDASVRVPLRLPSPRSWRHRPSPKPSKRCAKQSRDAESVRGRTRWPRSAAAVRRETRRRERSAWLGGRRGSCEARKPRSETRKLPSTKAVRRGTRSAEAARRGTRSTEAVPRERSGVVTGVSRKDREQVTGGRGGRRVGFKEWYAAMKPIAAFILESRFDCSCRCGCTTSTSSCASTR